MRVLPSDRLRLERESVRLVHKTGDPPSRRLRVFALDPAVQQDLGGIATLTIPYERLLPGPIGDLFAVNMRDPSKGCKHPQAELDTVSSLIEHGYTPSMSRREFAGQMLYAVGMSLYGQFVKGFGRDLPLGLHEIGGRWRGGKGLILKPFAMQETQAMFVPSSSSIQFGYHPARDAVSGFSPDSEVYSCFSHDIVVHELTHAFLHALRPNLIYPVNADVLALHEAFADLMAIFQRLRYDDFVLANIKQSGADIETWHWLHLFAGNYSSTAGGEESLRDLDGSKVLQEVESESPHDRGLIMVQAVFEAFKNILKERIDEVVLLATYGTGVVPRGKIAPVLAEELAKETQKVASHLQTMLIRAFDYIPPIGLRFGDYLRALITADAIMVPSDNRKYRLHIIEAFRRRGIFPTKHDGRSQSLHMTEDGLLIPALDLDIELESLSFSASGFSGDPSTEGLRDTDQHAKAVAAELGKKIAAKDGKLLALGKALNLDGVDQVNLLSIRPYRKLMPAGGAVVGTVIELSWDRPSRRAGRSRDPLDMDGALLLTDSQGRLDHVICHDDNTARREFEGAFRKSKVGSPFWLRNEDGDLIPNKKMFGLLWSERSRQD